MIKCSKLHLQNTHEKESLKRGIFSKFLSADFIANLISSPKAKRTASQKISKKLSRNIGDDSNDIRYDIKAYIDLKQMNDFCTVNRMKRVLPASDYELSVI